MDEKEPKSLLDLRAWGWTLVEEWPELFSLYERRGVFRVERSYELNKQWNAFIRDRRGEGSASAAKLESALIFLFARCCAPEAGVERKMPSLDEMIVDGLEQGLGGSLKALFMAQTRKDAENAADDCEALFKKAVRGWARAHFKIPAKGLLMPCMAINAAESLCAELLKLPTKGEVRKKMEELDFTYQKSNDSEAKWAELFVRAGLSGLAD